MDTRNFFLLYQVVASIHGPLKEQVFLTSTQMPSNISYESDLRPITFSEHQISHLKKKKLILLPPRIYAEVNADNLFKVSPVHSST